jgi:hypothetical protein
MSDGGPLSAALAPVPERALGRRPAPPPLATRPTRSDLLQLPGRHAAAGMTGWASALAVAVLPALREAGWGLVPRLYLGLAVGGLLFRLCDSAGPTWRRLRMRRVPLASGSSVGHVVRLVGTVRPDETAFGLPGIDRPVVYVRTRYLPVVRGLDVLVRGQEEIRGVPFRVETDDHLNVLVDPLEVRLIRNRDWSVQRMGVLACRALGVTTDGRKPRRYQQDLIAAGDRVELVGRLERQVVAGGAAAPGRGVPIDLLLRPAWNGGVWTRL